MSELEDLMRSAESEINALRARNAELVAVLKKVRPEVREFARWDRKSKVALNADALLVEEIDAALSAAGQHGR